MKNRVLMVFCITIFSLCAQSAATIERLEIIVNANMRTEPDNSAPVLIDVPKGSVVLLMEEQGSWYKIEHGGKEGWIFNKLARRVVQNQAGEIFTKQDVSVLPPIPDADIEEPKQQTKYTQVLKDNTPILEYLDPQAPLLYKARKGDVFVLVSEGESGVWCKVEYGDTTGWVRRSSVEISTSRPAEKAFLVSEAKSWLIVMLAFGIVVLALSGVMTFRHIRNERQRNVYIQKNALILAKESKSVQYMLTNSETSMERCFTEIGFNVSVLKDSVSARNAIEHDKPDIILVDWNFEPAILTKIDNLFSRVTAETVIPYFLFYNVSDPSSIPAVKSLRNVSFLGLTVSDRDIFKIVTPLIVHHEYDSSQNDVQKSIQRCALEGEIDGGNLLEVLQFIEIGSKTGCLMVETKGPFGLVYFMDGRIVYAAAAKGQGVEAVYAILNQPSGKFRFITNKQPKVANLNLPTLSVLMEWTKNKDEAHRG